jgi:hydrogenase maturation factor
MGKRLEIGKVPNDILNSIILGKIVSRRSEVMLKPKIGEDCCAVDFGENACILSSDPITGAVNEIGKLAVHISCNDIASCGVEPLGLLVTILVPPATTVDELETVMDRICETAAGLNVDILGGHTEITDAVTRFVAITTAVGKTLKGKVVSTSGAQEGDCVILTKSAGIEGISIIAHDREDELVSALGNELVKKAKSFVESISVVKEGVIAGSFGVNAMHDVTEGGVMGAVWELSEASDKGIIIYEDKIPIEPETVSICNYYGIDPLKLISSGCMLISCEDGEGLLRAFSEKGIKASIIGRITGKKEKLLQSRGSILPIEQPGSDELYRVISK